METQEGSTRSVGSVSGGLLYSYPTARDYRFYDEKKKVEKKLGRELTTREFIENHYDPPKDGPSGTSVFDPVTCELVYRWFVPPGGSILDPFAGGSVRGIVASCLGRPYVGVDLRAEQVEENRDQWGRLAAGGLATPDPDNAPELTPIEERQLPDERGSVLVKRDDDLCIAGVKGGKVRSCWQLAQGADCLVTASSRSSPQANIVAQVGKRLGIPVRLHIPSGALGPELQAAQAAGAEIVQHKAGRNSVIVSRARKDAEKTGARLIPFGMECEEAVTQTRAQVRSLLELDALPDRIVMPVGSGMSLAGVLHGLRDCDLSIPVIGVRVGADPKKRLSKYAPEGWEEMVELRDSGSDYHEPAFDAELDGLRVDPYYEGKCLSALEPGDLFWVVGIRQTAEASGDILPQGAPEPEWVCGDSLEVVPGLDQQFDFIFSCPPYADLEVYSDDPQDLSTMDYDKFLEVYRQIIKDSCARLRDNRFAAFVVGEVRNKKTGLYRNFVGETVRAFLDAGLGFYNEGILVLTTGNLAIRAGRYFRNGRKLGKVHQNLLVFVKGDWKKATEACGEASYRDPLDDDELIDEIIAENE